LGRTFVQYGRSEGERNTALAWQNGDRLESSLKPGWSTISVGQKLGMVILAIRRDLNLLHIGKILDLGTLRVK